VALILNYCLWFFIGYWISNGAEFLFKPLFYFRHNQSCIALSNKTENLIRSNEVLCGDENFMIHTNTTGSLITLHSAGIPNELGKETKEYTFTMTTKSNTN